jgi:sugar/nucleoside kinase (ribokinase family)
MEHNAAPIKAQIVWWVESPGPITSCDSLCAIGALNARIIHTYIDVTIMTDHVPTGDDKDVATEYAVSFGGNAVTAAFCCAKLGIKPDLVATGADDWLGDMFRDMARKYEVELHTRKVRRSSLSFVMPHGGERAILRGRDDRYLHPFPHLDITGCRVLHIDGHQPDAALHYARACREAGILTSLDGGGVRGAERGCRIGGVTFGERGLFWYDERGRRSTLPALQVPARRVIDTSGAGDVFHGAYVYSYLADPQKRWIDHFRFARAAAAFKVQRLGNEAGLPTTADVAALDREFSAAVENV